MSISVTRTDDASTAAQIINQDPRAYILGGGYRFNAPYS